MTNNKKYGYIYICSSDNSMPDIYKIGKTVNLKKQLSRLNMSRRNVNKFKFYKTWFVDDYDVKETILRSKYKQKRISGFYFKLSSDDINEINDNINKNIHSEFFKLYNRNKEQKLLLLKKKMTLNLIKKRSL